MIKLTLFIGGVIYDVCDSLFDDSEFADFIIDNKPYVDITGGEVDLFESAYYRVWQHICFFFCFYEDR